MGWVNLHWGLAKTRACVLIAMPCCVDGEYGVLTAELSGNLRLRPPNVCGNAAGAQRSQWGLSTWSLVVYVASFKG